MECSMCGECCKLFLINLTEEEWNSGNYKTMFNTDYNNAKLSDLNVLAQNEDESCVYLKDKKCSIHKNRPQVCKEFFCKSDNPKFKDMIIKIRETSK